MNNKSADVTELRNEAELIQDLRSTYPGLHVRPLSEYGQRFSDIRGVWTGGPGNMPDGLPIFDSLIQTCDEGYEGGVNDGFTEWLERRGWYIENNDGETMFILSIEQTKLYLGSERHD